MSDEIRRIVIVDNHMIIPDLEDKPLSELEFVLFNNDFMEKIGHPYALQAARLIGITDKVLNVSRSGTNKTMRGQLGENIIADVSGIWTHMQMLRQTVGTPKLDSEHELQIGVMSLLKGLRELYLYDDSSHLRRSAARYEKLHKLTKLPRPPGRKRIVSDFTIFVARWGETLSAKGYEWKEAAAEIMKQLEAESERSGFEEKLYKQWKNKKSVQRGKELSQYVTRYRKAIYFKNIFEVS